MDMLGIVCLAPVMIAVAVWDLKYMRIPNSLTVISLAILGVLAVVAPPEDIVIRVVVALVVLGLGLVAFAMRLIGGGDVKILSALMLAVPSTDLAVFANVFSAAMFVGIAAILAVRRFPQSTGWGWKSFAGSKGFPMGLSIALTGLVFPWVSLAFLSP